MSDKPRIEIDAFLNNQQFSTAALLIQADMDKIKRISDQTGISTSALNKAWAQQNKTVKETSMSWTDFRSAYSTVLDVMRVGQQIYDGTIAKHLEYADSIRNISEITKRTPEETSRLVQVFDDFKIKASQLTPILKAMTKEGLSPNIETMAKLSDEYIAIQDPVKKAEFLFKNFGRAGDDLSLVLSAGSEKLLEMNGAIDENLILTQKQIDQAREHELALDELSDRWQAFTTVLASDAIPTMNTLLELQSKTQEKIDEGTYSRSALYQSAIEMNRANEIAASVERELAIAKREGMDVTLEQIQVTDELVLSMEDLSKENQNFLSTLGTMQSETESFNQKYQEINEDMNLSDDERKAKLAELTAEHELSNRKIILGLLERKLTQDGMLDDKELQWLLAKGVAWGIYSQTVVDETQKAIEEANNLATALGNLPTEGSFTFYMNTVGEIQGVSGTNSVANQRVERRAGGGTVSGGKMYEVTENNMPELLQMGGKQFLMMPPSSGGNVVPSGGMSGGSGGGITRADIQSLISAVLSTRVDPYDFARITAQEVMRYER